MLKINRFENNFERPDLLDGAIGSYIQQKGFEVDDILWTTKVIFENPELMIQIHQEYINAGADIITTNTFRTNPSSLSKSGFSSPEKYVKQAVRLASQAAQGTSVLIAGSNPPSEDCYKKSRSLTNKEVEKNHKKHIDLLIDNKVDLILNETQSHLDEIRIICQYCDDNSLPYIISLYLDEKLNLLSGENIDYVLSLLHDYNPMAIGFNCISAEVFLKIIRSTTLPTHWGFYLNCGSGRPQDKIINCDVNPDEYINIVKAAMVYHPAFVGSCCGSNPEHTKSLRKFFDG